MSSGARIHITVTEPRAHSYEVVVCAGVLNELPARVAAAAPAARYAVIVPDDIAASYGTRVITSLTAAGLDGALLEFRAGEVNKTRETWSGLTDLMLELRFGRDTCVIALGGGVTGDLAGFVAATYMRGVPLLQVPTTLLAMLDASVGGKTGVDTRAGKNLVGAFHAPALVLVDPLVLATLPKREFLGGMAEAIKHGAILDRDYFDWIDRNAGDILAHEPDILERLVARSVELKAAVVTRDPYERGERAALNFGHTIAHALELQADYTLPHGYAVAAGMVVEAEAGEIAGITERGTSARIAALLDRFGLPTGPGDVRLPELVNALALDKKARRAQARFAIPARLGTTARPSADAWTCALPDDALKRALAAVSGDARAV